MTLEPLNCPNCGAPLPDPSGRALVMCTHCHTVVRVADAASAAGAPPTSLSAPPEDRPYTPSQPIPAEVSAKLLELLRAGRKTEAVEYYQTAAQVNEADARDVVDAIQAGLRTEIVPTGTVDLDRIKWLLSNRRRMYAVQLYREQAGVTLSDAAKAVDAIAAGREPPPIVRVAAGDGRLPAEARAELLGLVKGGKKIEAIKRYRELTGLGLKEAKEAVEAIERGQEPPVTAMARAMHHVPPGVDLAHIQDLLRQKQKIEAIKAYREATGLGLKEAKDAVEAIAASTPGVDPSLGKSDARGCFNCLSVMVICFLLLFGGCGLVAQSTGTYRCAVAEVKRADVMADQLGSEVNAGYVVLAPNFGQSWDLDGSWRRSMELFMPAWGSRGLGLLYMEAIADDTGYTAMRAVLWKNFERHVVRGWGSIECR